MIYAWATSHMDEKDRARFDTWLFTPPPGAPAHEASAAVAREEGRAFLAALGQQQALTADLRAPRKT